MARMENAVESNGLRKQGASSSNRLHMSHYLRDDMARLMAVMAVIALDDGMRLGFFRAVQLGPKDNKKATNRAPGPKPLVRTETFRAPEAAPAARRWS
jgi:hypothetical protein